MDDAEELVGKKFRPTFESEIDHFEIRGVDKKRAMVLTTAHMKSGGTFEDEISLDDLANGFRNGDYESLSKKVQGKTIYLTNPHAYLDVPGKKTRSVKFTGPSCGRCENRFGGSNSKWCAGHCNDANCYRFKLER